MWRIVPVDQVILGDDLHGGLLLVAYVQTADGARFTMAIGMAGSPGMRGRRPGPGMPPQRRRFTAADDRGTSYQLGFMGQSGVGVLELSPAPPHAIRWLDLTTFPGEPAIRDETTGDQYVTQWPPGREYVRRGTTPASLGQPEPRTDVLVPD